MGPAFEAWFRTGLSVSNTLRKAAATLNVIGGFSARQDRYEVLAAGLNSRHLDTIEGRFVKLNFSYKFGNQRVQGSQRRSTGSEAGKSRVGNWPSSSGKAGRTR